MVSLAARISELRCETAEIVAETFEAVRRSQETIVRIRAAARREAWTVD
jgi:hypothetical protein